MKKMINRLFSRAFLVGAAILIQILAIVIVVWKFSNYFVYFYGIFLLISVCVVLYVSTGKSNPAYKIAWIVPIMTFPIFGGLFYLMFGGNKSSKKNKKKMQEIDKKVAGHLLQDTKILEQLEKDSMIAANQAKYIKKYSSCPVYVNTTTEYLSPGEKKFECMLKELEKAEKYIFLEYFIIQEGVMWNAILEILKEKAKQGLDVRVIYDDVGCLMMLPFGYDKRLEEMGIKCCVFNPFVPLLSIRMNNRDHRKIVIIDGCTAFTGGINLADEYINEYEKYGHWKDSSIVMHGDAAWSMTVMFLSMWDYIRKGSENYEIFKPMSTYRSKELSFCGGYVQPFTDNPLDEESVGESAYLNLINQAEKYVYIFTPYLILDNEMITALCLAAKRGVDVRIMTPGIPDKWYIHAVTRANYEILVEAEVHIYEYMPGFVHAKIFVVDDQYAIVGTINLDYRSLYLHFECGIWLYKTETVLDVKTDYLETLKDGREISLTDCKNVKFYRRFCRMFLKLLAPLM